MSNPTLLRSGDGRGLRSQWAWWHLAVLLPVAILGSPPSLPAQAMDPPAPEEVEAARSAPLFSSHQFLDLTLEADFHSVRREDRSDEDSEPRPAVLRWTSSDGTPQAQNIEIQTRGNFRLSKRNCDFPPLRLNVKKGEVEGTVFEGQDKMKLVGICKVKQDYWEQYVVTEYLVYRTFNLLSDLSFRVRPLRVTYVDTSGEDDTFTRFAFIIEHDSQMAARNGGRIFDWETGQLDPRLLEKEQAILVDIFQYMIGNTDWSGVEMHNMALFRHADGQPAAVPYDFDFSGIVDARYAVPDPMLSIRSVRRRLFRGFCPDQMNREPELYDEAFDLFREKKDEIYQLWRDQEALTEDKLQESLAYLDEFFEILDDPGDIERYILRDCRRIRGLGGGSP